MAAFNYMIILIIGTIGLLWSHLDILLDVRGAIDFVRPFHAACLIITVTTATFTFDLLLRRGPAILEGRPVLQTGGYLFCVLAAWFIGLPFGDYVAESWERTHKIAAEVGDTGYGWFYTDDSGMGHWPMSLMHVIYVALVFPIVPILWTLFTYFVLKTRHLSLSLRGVTR